MASSNRNGYNGLYMALLTALVLASFGYTYMIASIQQGRGERISRLEAEVEYLRRVIDSTTRREGY